MNTTTAQYAKDQIKKMTKFDINKLSALSVKTGISLMTLNFWYNAIKN